MALILCIESSTKVCSVSLGKNGSLVSLRELKDGNFSHSENLTDFIQQVCLEATIALKEIDAVAVSKGPGSYTGLRIGVSAAKGIGYALNKPLLSITSLQGMAEQVRLKVKSEKIANKFFCPMLDARRMEVYCALYNEALKEELPTAANVIEEASHAHFLHPYIEKPDSKIYIFGEGSDKCKPYINHPTVQFIENIFASSQYMIPLAEKLFNQKQFEDVAYFEPFYLKDFVGTK
jgi:tRNA threonylcarbamoyladenosine biosynthesis protein TsaB